MGNIISARIARHIAVTEYGYSRNSAAVRLRKAAERGRDGKGMIIATSHPVDGWQYDEDALRAWLADPAMHKRGPAPQSTPSQQVVEEGIAENPGK